MSKEQFHEGQKLKAIYFADDENTYADNNTTITVVMELAQMSLVPWAIVEGTDGIYKWNLALVLGVRLEQE